MAVLIEIDALSVGAGSRVTLRFAGSDDARITSLNGVAWWPGIITAPVLSIEGWDGNFTSSAILASASFTIDPAALRRNDAASPAYRWAGAAVRIYEGNAGAAWGSWALRFAGLIDDYSTDDAGRYTLTAKVDGEPFETPVLGNSYAGTGGAEGGADLKQKPKPAVFGQALNIEPVLINATDNVYQVHGYGSIAAVLHVYERAADLVENGGNNVGNYATYAALVAATIPEGSFGTCLAEGMFRLGAPPAGLVTCDVNGDNALGFVRGTAEVINRICALTGVPSGRLDSANLLALQASVPYAINLYLTQQIKVIDLMQTLARPCNAQALISWTGVLRIVRFGAVPTPAMTLDGDGRALPAVLAIQETKTSPPYWRIEMRGARCWRAHSKDEIAFEDLSELVNSAQASADAAAAAINRLADDGILTKNEKITQLIPLSAELEAAWSLLDTQASGVTFSVVVSAKAAAIAARTAWLTYRNGLSPAWNTITADTTVTRSVFNTIIGDYRAAIDTLADALRRYAATLALWGSVTGTGRPEDNSTRNDDGANMLFAPHDPAGWGFANGATLAHLGTGRPLLANSAQLGSAFHQIFWSTGRRIQVVPGDELWFRHTVARDASVASGGDNVRGGLLRFDSSGAQLPDGTDIPGSAISASEITPGQYVTRYGKVTIPDGVAFIQTYSVRLGSSGGSFYVAEPFLNRFEPGATDGATAGANLLRADGVTVMSQAEVRTVEGTSLAIVGQAPTATSSDFSAVTGATKPANNATVGAVWGGNLANRPDWATNTATAGGVEVLQGGYVYRGASDLRNMYDYFPASTLADRTAAATAAGFYGQGSLASQNAINLAYQASGKLPDSRNLNASNNFGLRGLSTAPVLGDTVIGGQLYLTIGASTFYGDWGGTVSYPSATIGPGPFGLTYYIWRIVSGPDDAGYAYSASPQIENAVGANKVYLGYVIARAYDGAAPGTGGAAGSTPGGTSGGGGGGTGNPYVREL